MFWTVLNSLLSAFVAAFVAYKLLRYGDMLNLPERIGMGLWGGAAILTIGTIWQPVTSPFEGWGASLWRVGILIYLAGRLSRHQRHRRANNAAVILAKAHLLLRGKL